MFLCIQLYSRREKSKRQYSKKTVQANFVSADDENEKIASNPAFLWLCLDRLVKTSYNYTLAGYKQEQGPNGP